MKGILKAKGRGTTVPGDALASHKLACKYRGQSGLPQAADSIAYDPVQKLIAVRVFRHCQRGNNHVQELLTAM